MIWVIRGLTSYDLFGPVEEAQSSSFYFSVFNSESGNMDRWLTVNSQREQQFGLTLFLMGSDGSHDMWDILQCM